MNAPDLSRATWRKSSYSGSNGNCVETAAANSVVAVRDTQDPTGPRLAFAPSTWSAFARKIKPLP